MFKVALIGIGGMGGHHFNVYKGIEDCKVVAVADVRTDMAKEKVNDESVHIYSDIDDLLANETVDMVDICTPSYMHADMSIKTLQMGINTLSEKPMTINSADAERIIKATEKSDAKFMVAHVVRFMAPYAYLADEIKKGEMGELLRLDMKRAGGIPRWSWEDWMRDCKKSGGTPIDLSIHDIDFVQSVLGQPDEVNGVYHKMNNDNDFIVANMTFGKTVVSTEGTWYNYDLPFDASFRAVFQNGYIQLKDNKLYKNGEEVELNAEDEHIDSGINVSGTDGYATEIKYFIDCVKNNISPDFVSPESSKASVSLVERIIENSIIL